MSERYNFLQIGRAFAAMAVVLGHSVNITNNIAPQGLGLPEWVSFGYSGVDIFFVISGFIIGVVASSNTVTASNFLWRRAIRILPFYWAFTIIWILLNRAGGHAFPSALALVQSLLVLPQSGLPLLAPGWTLEHEFIFYGFVASLLAIGRLQWLPIVLAVVAIFGIVLHVLVPAIWGGDVWDFHVASLYQVEFLAGVLLFKHRNKVRHWDWRACLVIGACLFVGTTFLVAEMNGNPHISTTPTGLVGLLRVIGFGAAGFALLAGGLAFEFRRPSYASNRGIAFLILVGDASYALYLSHPIVFGVIGVGLSRLHAPVTAIWPAFLMGIALAVILAVLWYQAIENPTLSYILRKRRRAVLIPAETGV